MAVSVPSPPLPATVVSPSARFAVGFAEDIGCRRTMEDTMSVVGCMRGRADEDYFAVYDGHGGKQVADWAHMHVHEHVARCLADAEAGAASAASDEAAIIAAISRAFLEANDALREQEPVAMDAGATAAACLVRGNMLYAANAGDARAVLGRRSGAVRLTHDHKPGLPEEKARITAAGGFVFSRGGVDRVDGFLAVSRAFGDLCLAPKVTAEPFVSSTKLQRGDDFLILACDGVWDVLSDEQAVERVAAVLLAGRTAGAGATHSGAATSTTGVAAQRADGGGGGGSSSSSSKVQLASEVLLRGALQAGSRDNVSVMVVDFGGVEFDGMDGPGGAVGFTVGNVASAPPRSPEMPGGAAAQASETAEERVRGIKLRSIDERARKEQAEAEARREAALSASLDAKMQRLGTLPPTAAAAASPPPQTGTAAAAAAAAASLRTTSY
jgi:serine/threonine protein phosphatase PrpC